MNIGSFFSLELNKNTKSKNIFEDIISGHMIQYFSSGRNALKYILSNLKDREKHKAYLPKYICESVVEQFSEYNVAFFELESDMQIDLNDLMVRNFCRGDIIFAMAYFGCEINDEIIKKLKEIQSSKGVIIIQDCTHTFVDKNKIFGNYCILSLRKWFPIPDGGILFCDESNYLKIKQGQILSGYFNSSIFTGMVSKFLNNDIMTQEIYSHFLHGEKQFSNEGIYEMSYLSKEILCRMDIHYILYKRKRNYEFLKNQLIKIGYGPINNIVLSEGIPFAYVIKEKNNIELQKFLSDNGIFCPIHWPIFSYGSEKINTGFNLLSIPIDHRYDEKHMQYIIDKFNEWIAVKL